MGVPWRITQVIKAIRPSHYLLAQFDWSTYLEGIQTSGGLYFEDELILYMYVLYIYMFILYMYVYIYNTCYIYITRIYMLQKKNV